MAKVANFVTSLVSRLTKGYGEKKQPDRVRKERRLAVVSWFSTSDLDSVDVCSTFLHMADSASDAELSSPRRRNRDSGYSSKEDTCDERIWEHKICIHLEEGELITNFLPEFGTGGSTTALDSSLIRCTSIQDRSLKVTHRRRENVAKKYRRHKYSSFKRAIFPDEGTDIKSDKLASTDHSSDETSSPSAQKKSQLENRPMDEARGNPNFHTTPHDVITRRDSVLKKSWEIRRRRKQIAQRKRRSVVSEYFPVGHTESQID